MAISGIPQDVRLPPATLVLGTLLSDAFEVLNHFLVTNREIEARREQRIAARRERRAELHRSKYHELQVTVVIRDTVGFEPLRVPLLNPWPLP